MKKYWYLISGITFSTLIVLILIVEHKGNYFKATPAEAHKILLNNDIAIDSATISSLTNAVLLIRLSENIADSAIFANKNLTINIKPENLLNPENRKIYKNHSGLIILKADNLTLAANAWVLLSRMGYRNIKIWNENADETFKYSFQPD